MYDLYLQISIENQNLMKKNKNTQLRNSIGLLSKKMAEKAYSLHHLYVLNNKLDNEKQQRKKVLQKMKQDKAISNKIENIVAEEFEKVENNGVHFASKLEEEKRKNRALIALVSHYESLIYKQKQQNRDQMVKTKQIKEIPKEQVSAAISYVNSKTKTENFLELKNQKQNSYFAFSSPSKTNRLLQQQLHHLKYLQSQFQQYILKNNTSQYQLSKKLDEVRTIRSERTVFNKVFDQFEKQLFEHEFDYKKLVIQRTILENQFENKIKSYQDIAAKAQKQYEKMLKNKKKIETDRIFNTFSIEREQNKTINHVQKKQQIGQLQIKQESIENKQQLNDISTIRHTYAEQVVHNMQNNEDIYIRFSAPRDKKISFKAYQNHNRCFTQNLYQNNQLSRCNNTVKTEISDAQYQVSKQKNLQYQKKVKQIYEQLKIMSSLQIPTILENLQTDIANLYCIQQQLSENLYQKEKYYKNYEQFRHKNGSKVILNQNLSQMMLIQNGDQQKNIEKFINKKQRLRNKWSQIQKQNQKIINQLNNFSNTQINRVKLLQKDKSLNNINTKQINNQTQNQVNLQSFINKICQLEEQFSRIHLFQPKNILLYQGKKLNGVTSNRYIAENLQKQAQIPQKQTKRDTHKSKLNQYYIGGTMNSITNANQSFYKQRTYKPAKSRYVQNKQGPQTQQKVSKLQYILQANRTTHNTISIYTQEQLMQISRRIINKEKQKSQSFNQNSNINLTINNFQQMVNRSSRSNKSNFFSKNKEIKDHSEHDQSKFL